MNIVSYNHTEPELWPWLGPWATDRAVHKELGGAIYSSPETMWFLALTPHRMLGLSALRHYRQEYWLDYSWVAPDHRRKGVMTALTAARDRLIPAGATVRVVCREERWHHYALKGFSIDSQRGTWIYGSKS